MLCASILTLALGAVSGAGDAAAEDYRELVCSYNWDCEKALRVAACESTMNPRAYADGNYGLFGVNAVHAPMVNGNLEALYSPEVNVSVAFSLYQSSGWQPWAYCGQR